DRGGHRGVTGGAGGGGGGEGGVETRAVGRLEGDRARLFEYGRACPERRRRAQRQGQRCGKCGRAKHGTPPVLVGRKEPLSGWATDDGHGRRPRNTPN